MSNVSRVEYSIFDEIKLDVLNIHINGKRIPISHEVGIYNQILGYLKMKHRVLVPKLDAYIAELYDAKLPLANEYKAKWVDKLVLGVIPNLYATMFKIKRVSPTVLELYAVNNGNVLEYICRSAYNMFWLLKDRCQFWQELDDFCVKYNVDNPAYLTVKEIQLEFRDAMRKKIIEEVPDIKILSNSVDEYCLAYYDLNMGNALSDTPAWDSFLSSMMNDSCRRAFMAWVYSVFVGDNVGRQALIVHGIGDTGKSAIANAIFNRLELLNPDLVTTLEAEEHMDKFSSASYIRKRLVLGADSTDRGILRNKIVKNITGKDKTSVRKMGKDKEYAQTYAKIMITSNVLPFIDPDKPEEVSRCLLISLIPEKCIAAKNKWHADNLGDWQSMLALEIDNFIAKCKGSYYEFLMPNGNDFKPYDNYNEVLDISLYYLKRDVPVWWDTCIEHTGNQNDVLQLTEMYDDYIRFVLEIIKRVKRMRWMVEKQVLLYVREQMIEVHTLNNFSVLYVRGYRFKESLEENRLKATDVIEQQIGEVSYE